MSIALNFSGMPQDGKAILPPGEYWLGDPSYVLDLNLWDVVSDKGEGFYVSNDDNPSDWKHMYIFRCALGPGIYQEGDNQETTYLSNSGYLAILDRRLVAETDMSLNGTEWTFSEPCYVEFDEDRFITIMSSTSKEPTTSVWLQQIDTQHFAYSEGSEETEMDVEES